MNKIYIHIICIYVLFVINAFTLWTILQTQSLLIDTLATMMRVGR